MNNDKDKKWLETRKEKWDYVSQYNISTEIYTVKEYNAYHSYFFSGDFEQLISAVTMLSFSNAVGLYPTKTLDGIKYIIKKYWKYADDEEILKDNKDFKFIDVLSSISFTNHQHSSLPSSIHSEIFFWLYGDTFKDEVLEIDIDIFNWLPRFTPDPKYLGKKFIHVYNSLFFENGGEKKYAGFEQLLDYYISMLPYQDPQYNLIQLANPKKNRLSRNLFYSQIGFRKLLLSLLGIQDEGEVQNFPELQMLLSNKLFNELSMPKSFYKLVDYLKEHERSVLEFPKKK